MIPTSMIKNITVLKFRGQNFRVLDFSEKKMIPTSMIKNITVLKFRGQNFRVLNFLRARSPLW